MAFSFEFCMSVLTKIAAAVGHQVLGPLLVVVLLLLRRRWLMVPIIAEAVLRPVLMGVVLMLGHRVVLLRMMVVMLMVALMGGWHGIVHITAAIYIGVRVAGRWWGGHYTRHARTDCTTQTANRHHHRVDCSGASWAWSSGAQWWAMWHSCRNCHNAVCSGIWAGWVVCWWFGEEWFECQRLHGSDVWAWSWTAFSFAQRVNRRAVDMRPTRLAVDY